MALTVNSGATPENASKSGQKNNIRKEQKTMARTKKYVTRSMKTTACKVLGVNGETETVVKKDFVLPGTFKDDNAIIKYLSNIITPDFFHPVRVISSEVKSELYGVEEKVFLDNAVPMVNPYTPAENNTESED